MMWCLLVVAAVGVSSVDVKVNPLSGDAIQGKLTAISAKGLEVETSEGTRELAFADLLAVTPQNEAPAAAARPAYWIRLADGSLLLAAQYSVKQRSAKIALLDGSQIEVPTRSISWVRFREPSDALNSQWKEIAGQKVAGDVIVIRKSATALDQLEGVVQDIDDKTVHFDFSGDKIPVGLKKLEGVVYFHPLGNQVPKPLCKLTMHDGSLWQATSVRLSDGKLEVVTGASVKATLSLSHVRLMDFSSGNLVYLSDMEPESAEWTPFFESPRLAAKLAKWFGPQGDRTFEGRKKLRLGDRVYDKGLALHSRTELVYRLTDAYRRLQADVGIDASVGNLGHVELVITGDGRELFRSAVKGDEPAQSLDLDIQGVRRLRILVDYGENNSIGDHLNLCNARIIK